MATERQISANRGNSQKSTGPRSFGGKRRASRNAYHHGLSVNISSIAAFEKQLEELAREIVADRSDAISLGRARNIAAALDLHRARATKVALIERVRAFGSLESPPEFKTVGEFVRFFDALDRGKLRLPKRIDPATSMPSKEPDRSVEAVRRVLPELVKLDRYERSAFARRERALRDLISNPPNVPHSELLRLAIRDVSDR